MDEKLLHSVPITANVEEYSGSGSRAKGSGGGFPCQARSSVLFSVFHFILLAAGPESGRTAVRLEGREVHPCEGSLPDL